MKLRRGLLYLLVLLMIAALVWLVFRFAPSASVDTPEVILPTAPVSAAPGDGEQEDEDTVELVDVTTDTVQAVIGALDRADSYARTLTLETLWNSGSAVRTIDVWVRGDNARFVINEKKGVKNVLIRGDELWIWYGSGTELYHGLASERDADEYQALLSYEDVLDIDKRDILDAGYTEYDGELCVYATYTHGELGYTSTFWVSTATGLLMGSETYDGDTLVYVMSSSPADISTPDDEVFVHP